jgi:DNA-binding beta-propeller fold protein YncE
MLRWILSGFVVLAVSGCAMLAGKDEGQGPAGREAIRISFVEMLRNEASLRGEAFREIDIPRDPALSTVTLQRPIGVFADAFRVYVTDANLQKVFIFDRGSRTVTFIQPAALSEAAFSRPSGVAVDAANVVYVADSQKGMVFGFDLNGNPLSTIARWAPLTAPAGLAVDRMTNRLYVADPQGRRVRVFTTVNGELVSDLTNAAPGEAFRSPRAVALDKAGNLLVLDDKALRVTVVEPSGKVLRVFPLRAEGLLVPTRPRGIAVDSAGHVYITDDMANGIFIYDVDGTFLQRWGRPGSLTGEFQSPEGIYIDNADLIYVADQVNGRVQVFRYLR